MAVRLATTQDRDAVGKLARQTLLAARGVDGAPPLPWDEPGVIVVVTDALDAFCLTYREPTGAWRVIWLGPPGMKLTTGRQLLAQAFAAEHARRPFGGTERCYGQMDTSFAVEQTTFASYRQALTTGAEDVRDAAGVVRAQQLVLTASVLARRLRVTL